RTISVAPSAGWWQRATAAAATRGCSACPTDPGSGPTDPTRGPTDPARGRTVLVSGPDLPHGATEVEALRAVYPDAVTLTGAAATTRAVGDALDSAALAHIAAHGRFRADQP